MLTENPSRLFKEQRDRGRVAEGMIFHTKGQIDSREVG